MIFILGSLIVGILQCIVPFIDKLPLMVLTTFEYMILKLMLCLIPIIIFTSYIFYYKKNKCKFYNKKIILIAISTLVISAIYYYLYLYLIKKYSPGIIMPIILSSIVVFTFVIDYFFFNRNISKIEVLCIFLIGVSIYILSSNVADKNRDKSLNNWIEYLKR